MADIVDITLSSSASIVADQILDMGLFKNKSDVMAFAAAYVIKNHFDSFDPETYYQTDTSGSNYSFSTFDSDGKWSSLIKALYPETDTPYLYLRSLMNQGLLLIEQKIQEDSTYSLINEIG